MATVTITVQSADDDGEHGWKDLLAKRQFEDKAAENEETNKDFVDKAAEDEKTNKEFEDKAAENEETNKEFVDKAAENEETDKQTKSVDDKRGDRRTSRQEETQSGAD